MNQQHHDVYIHKYLFTYILRRPVFLRLSIVRRNYLKYQHALLNRPFELWY